MFYYIIFLINIIPFYCWIAKTNLPKSLWGKRIMVNGPRENIKNFSPFDGIGHITSLVFGQNETVISEVIIPDNKYVVFPLSDFLKRDYLSIISKLPHLFFKTKRVQSGTRNTAVILYNNQYYAVEESCRPIKLNYNENNELYYNGESQDIPRMSVHMPDKYTMFSYDYPSSIPLKINNTRVIPWNPKIYPFLMHDSKTTNDSNYFIFPLMSSSMGRFFDYFKKIIDMPVDEFSNKAGWLIYNSKNNSCHEIMMDEYTDIFHISHVEKLYKNVHKIYASFVYNFPGWLTGTSNLDIRLKEVVVNLDNYKIVKKTDTGLKMDFIHKINNELIGSCLDDFPAILKYNVKTKQSTKIYLPGRSAREIIPFEDMVLYFSHNVNRSYLYIFNITSNEIIDKINIPHRLPGFHTTLFD